MEQRWNDIDRGDRRSLSETRPSATLSTTNTTWTALGSNPGRSVEKPPTNRLCHGTAFQIILSFYANNVYKLNIAKFYRPKMISFIIRNMGARTGFL
jgi:hypothetical protein